MMCEIGFEHDVPGHTLATGEREGNRGGRTTAAKTRRVCVWLCACVCVSQCLQQQLKDIALPPFNSIHLNLVCKMGTLQLHNVTDPYFLYQTTTFHVSILNVLN